jgi:putative ABC transport system ATP-binding protein
LASLIKFGKHVEGFYDLMASVDKIGHLLDLPLEREHGQIVTNLGRSTTVHVRDLTYTYAGSARSLFSNLNLQIEAGSGWQFPLKPVVENRR